MVIVSILSLYCNIGEMDVLHAQVIALVAVGCLAKPCKAFSGTKEAGLAGKQMVVVVRCYVTKQLPEEAINSSSKGQLQY